MISDKATKNLEKAINFEISIAEREMLEINVIDESIE